MADNARVDSIDALKHFRIQLIKFAEVCSTALTDAEGEMHRVMGWLERDQANYWQAQLRKRAEYVEKCKEAVRMKKLFKGPDGRPASSVDEEKALATAIKRFQEGEQKAKAVAAYSRKLPREILMYKGQVQRFSSALQSDVPFAAAQLGQMIIALESYVSMQASAGAGPDGGPLITADTAGAQTMTRGEGFSAEKQWEALRGQVPPGPLRSGAAELGSGRSPLATATLTSAESEKLGAIPGPREVADPESRFVLTDTCMSSKRIFLVRTEISFPGDSGWYAGSTDAVPAGQTPKLMSLKVSELIKARPDLKEMLNLPRGYLIVLDGGGVSAMLDPADREIWKSAAAGAGAPAQPPASPVPAAAR